MKTLFVRLPEDLKAFVESQAAALGLSINAYMIMLLNNHRKENTK